MSLRTRFLAALIPALGAIPFVMPGTAAALSGSCYWGQHTWVWTQVTSGNLIRQADVYENFSRYTVSVELYASSQTTLTDRVTASVDVTASATAIFESLDAKFSAEVGHVGETTTFSSIRQTYTVAPYNTVVLYGGVKQYLGWFDYYGCDGSYHWQYLGSGRVYGYSARVSGIVECDWSPPAGSMGYTAKAVYC
jgi:hypothetical protein